MKCLISWLFLCLCGCTGAVTQPQSQKARYVSYFEQGHENCTLSQIENELGLGVPVEVKKPVPNDPSWWFTYRTGGCTVDVSANVEEDQTIDQAKADRSKFYFADLSWVTDQSDTRPRRYDKNGSPSLTTNIGSPRASFDTAEGRVLSNLNISTPCNVADLQKKIGLTRPVNVEPPAFIRPYWYIFYYVDDRVVTLTAVLDDSHKDVNDVRDTERYLFSGYWTVEHREK